MELRVAAGVDGGLEQGTEQVVEEDTEVLENVVTLVDVTVKEGEEEWSESDEFVGLFFVVTVVRKLGVFL